MAEFREGDHPRAADGKFGSGGGSSSPKLTPTEKSHISSYTGDDFHETNKKLRSGESGGDSVKHIDAAINKATLPAGTKLYRGMDKDAAIKFFGTRDITAGMEISDKAFMSTSRSSANFGYGSFGGVMFEIETGDDQHGLDVAQLTRNPSEQEVLLPRNTKMRVKSIVAPKKLGDPIRIKVSTVSGDDRSKNDAAPDLSAPLYTLDEGRVIRAAGVLFVAHDQVLLLKRSDTGEWAFPGGQIEADESIEEAAVRECREEMGGLPDGKREPFDHSADGLVDFTTFIQACEPFNPTLNDEHTGFVWATLGDYPQPMHPGAAATLDKLTRTELDVARDMSAGLLPSPQKFQGVTMFDLRVTGTGQTFRSKDRQHVYRPDEHYLNDTFLARCNGLPVIFLHPKGMLNSDEFGERVVGAIFLPYIKGDEVWCIARIYDDTAIAEMQADQLSTSPGVKFRTMAVCTTVPIEGGASLLLEGNPHLLDHLAIVPNGVWDKGGDPSGINSLITGDDTMTDEEKAAAAIADRAKKDGDERFAKLDAEFKAKADSDKAFQSKMDAFMDSYMKDKKDAQEKCDAEEKAKADAEEKAKVDAEEKAKADKKDAEEKEKRDADEKEAKEKADADVAAKLAADAAEDGAEAEMADAQEKCDSVAQAFGKRAPPPLRGEKTMAYRKRLLSSYKQYSPDYKEVDLGVINDAALLATVEKRIFTDAMVAAQRPTDVPVGQLREITRVDPHTGVRETTFYGNGTTFIAALKRPSARVTDFLTPNRSH